MRLLAILIFLAVTGQSAWSQEVPETPTPLMTPQSEQVTPHKLPGDVISLRQLAARHYHTGNSKEFVRVMEKLNGMRPYNGEYMYQLVIAYAHSNQPSKAYNLMLIMQQQGLSYDFAGSEDVANIRDTQVFEYLSDLMVRAGESMGTGTVAFSLPEDLILPEAIDWDASQKEFIIGNVATGTILRVNNEGQAKPFIQSDPATGPWGVFDLKIDAQRKLLWVSSAASSTYRQASADNRGKSGLFKFNLETGELLGSYLVTDTEKIASAVANIALASDGSVYVADSLRPVIYKINPGGDALVPAFASSSLISIRGLALSEDDKTLYMADYELGILVLKLEDKTAFTLAVPAKFNAGGIDGLYLWNNHLIAIQNGNSPERVMRLELDTSGGQVINVRPLEVAHPEFDAPNYGTVVGDDLYYFGNSHWHRLRGDGSLLDGKRVSVMKTSLFGGADLVSPEMERFMDKLRKTTPPVQAKPGLLEQKPGDS